MLCRSRRRRSVADGGDWTADDDDDDDDDDMCSVVRFVLSARPSFMTCTIHYILHCLTDVLTAYVVQ